jgi:hypothetical protein
MHDAAPQFKQVNPVTVVNSGLPGVHRRWGEGGPSEEGPPLSIVVGDVSREGGVEAQLQVPVRRNPAQVREAEEA